MSMWDNMSFAEKLLAVGALAATGGVAASAVAGDAAIPALGGSVAGGSVPIDLTASGIGAGAGSAAPAVASDVVPLASNAVYPNAAAAAASPGTGAATILGSAATEGAGAGATGQMAVADNALYANAANQTATTPAPWYSNLLHNAITPAQGATGTFGTGMGYGAAGQAGLIGLGGGLGYAAIRAADKGYGVPAPTVDTGPLSRLQGAQGVPYLTDRGTTKKASGGLLSANPNPPMSYNTTPTYNNPTSTPVPQPVMHFAGGGSSQSDIIAPTPATGAYDQLGAYLQAMQAAQSQQAGQQELQAQQDAQQRAAQQSLMPGPTIAAAGGGMMYGAGGGISSLGHYSDGGQMLKGPGDGMSDSIPATIAGKQPARLANDEFVVPADVVSHLGNGSSDAGAKKLYDMMDRVRRARTGTPKQAKAIHPDRYVPG